jgi:hypothetical protein
MKSNYVHKVPKHGNLLDILTGLMLFNGKDQPFNGTLHFAGDKIGIIFDLNRKITEKDICKYFRPGISDEYFGPDIESKISFLR